MKLWAVGDRVMGLVWVIFFFLIFAVLWFKEFCIVIFLKGPVSEPEPEPEPEPARPTRRPKMVPAILRRPTSPVSRECNSSTDSCDSGPSNTPPEIHPVVPLCPIKPVAVRVGGRRQAVECIEDLLNEPGQPLDLSCKRPRP